MYRFTLTPVLAALYLALIAGSYTGYRIGSAGDTALQESPSPTPSASAASPAVPTSSPTTTPIASPSTTRRFIEPIAEFKQRITLKRFGTYVTPTNSPVSPERFTGYHTAVDVEYADTTVDIPVVAAAAGTVVRSATVDGYGGVLVVQHTFDTETLYTLYGHLRPASMLANGTKVAQGQELGLLGSAYSAETDNERRHLHFAISRTLNLRGYVAASGELSPWIDPLSFFP